MDVGHSTWKTSDEAQDLYGSPSHNPKGPRRCELTGVYHNLLRRWADV